MGKRAAVLLLLFAVSCRRSPGPPDPNYDQGAKLYQQLYAEKIDEAYGDPRMDSVVSLLKKVDRHSIDASSADALLDTIQHGRTELQKTHAQRDQLQKGAEQVVAAAPNIDPVKVLGLDHPPPPVDAGAPPDPFGPGASISEINAASGGCLVPGEAFRENVTNRAGTVYRLSTAATCAQRLAGFAGQLVLVTDGKIYRRIPEAEAPQAAAPDAGAAATVDAGTTSRVADAGTVAGGTATANAGEGGADGGVQQYPYIPGAPLPPGAQFPGETAAADAGY